MMKKNKKLDVIFLLLLLLGVGTRIYLVFKLPIWHDEFFSIWASKQGIYEIIYSKADPVHPPGFYLFLHFWGFISQHLIWFRLITVFSFITNVFLIKMMTPKLGKPVKNNLLIFLYIFSGYFIVFDWQVRMYTFVDTAILSSIYFLTKVSDQKSKIKRSYWFILTIINFIGLYLDFSFVWFFIPTSLFMLVYFLLNAKKALIKAFLSFFLSGFLFLLFSPNIIQSSFGGIRGIEWMYTYSEPDYFVPFFFGSHGTLFYTLFFTILFFIGFYYFVKSNSKSFVADIITFSAMASYIFTIVFSIYVRQLFHVRSLQIIGLWITILYYFSIRNLSNKNYNFLIASILAIFIFNFINVNRIIIHEPNKVIIDFFPWKEILNSTDLTKTRVVKYQIENKLPTQLLLYGLEYTLGGNEDILKNSIPLELYDVEDKYDKCELFYSKLMKLYKCI